MSGMDSAERFDPERYTPVFAALGVVALAAAFHYPICILPAIAFLLLACLADTRKLYLFGPFLRLELRAMTRRVRLHLWWPLLALLAAAPVLGLQYAVTQLPPDQAPPAEMVSSIAAGGFLFVFWILMIVTLSLASTYLCYGVSEDRESKRLDFQLVTDLRGRELVIGKMLARLIAVLMYPLATVPILLTMPLLFRLDPSIILYAFGYGGAMLASISGLSALGSVLAATKKGSGNWMALFVMPYLFLVFLLSLLRFWPEVWFFPGTPAQPMRYAVGDLIEAFAIGNPLTLLVRWTTLGFGGGSLGAIAADFPGFAAFHTLVGGLAILLAARKVRTASANAGETVTPKEGEANSRPPVGDKPILWKEIHCNPLLVAAQKNKSANRIATLLLVILPAVVLLAAAAFPLGAYGTFIANDVARFLPIIIVIIGIFSSQNLALQSIPRERERDTLLNVLLSDLGPDEIFRQKYAGVQRIGRGIVIWFLIVGVPAVICGGYLWWALIGLLLYQIVFMNLMASIAFCFGATAPNIQVAGKRIGVAIFIATFALMASAGIGGALIASTSLESLKYIAVGLIPPFGLVAPGFAKQVPSDSLPYWIAGYVGGLFFYSLIARYLYCLARRRFAAACDGSAERGPLLDNRAP
ncbi:MAG: hypothetical protein KF873_17375 [Gemmataceae bacterium]|nr:hypothetical protein [Planctomycetia bacterium]MBX3400508.1 hypothetical protein [Gemmataceae bacterium]